MRSVYDAVLVVNAVAPVAGTGTGTPAAAKVSAIDTFGYNSCMFDIAVGTAVGTTSAVTLTVDAKVQESDTSGGTYTDFPATGTGAGTAVLVQITAVAGTNKHGQIRVEGLGTMRKRYLKLVITPSVTPTADARVPISGICILGRAFQGPAGNSTTAAAS